MKKIIKLTLAMLTCIYASTHAQTSGTLTIKAQTFKNDNGKAVAELFRSTDDIPGKPFTKVTANIIDGHAEVTIKNLSFGTYALILFHDENNNDILDHRFGFPNEPMAFSNNWNLSLFSGMPTFEKLKFEFSSDKPICAVRFK